MPRVAHDLSKDPALLTEAEMAERCHILRQQLGGPGPIDVAVAEARASLVEEVALWLEEEYYAGRVEPETHEAFRARFAPPKEGP